MSCTRPRLPVLLICLAALILAAAPIEARGEPGPVRKVREELHTRLHAMAKFCTSRKLFGARYDVYDLILTIWPDDEAARKSNGYTSEEGSWSKQGRKRPRNLAAGGVPALRALQEETAIWYSEAIAIAARELPPGMAAAWKARARSDAVGIAPSNVAFREKNGQVKGKDAQGKRGWILLETKKSRARRPKLVKAAKKALTSAPKAKTDTVREGEKSSTVTWRTAISGGHARLTGVTDRHELEEILRNVNATFPFFEAAFKRTPSAPRGLTVHVLDNISTGNVYLADQTDLPQSRLRFLTPLISLWIPKSARLLIKAPDPLVRLEAGPRMVFGQHMGARFGIHSKMGWAVEGFGLYLTWNLTGTRMINAVRESKYGEKKEKVDLAKRLKESDADWLAEARTLINGKFAPDLRLLLGKTVNTLTPEDVLYSYVFAMYLIEGHRDKLGGFLPAVAGVKDAGYDLAFAEHLGFDVATTERRLKRWLAETANLK